MNGNADLPVPAVRDTGSALARQETHDGDGV